MSRGSLLPVIFVAAVLLRSGLSAQESAEPAAHRIGDFSFFLPKSWQVQNVGTPAAAGVQFAADGGRVGRFTLARLSATANASAIVPSHAPIEPLTANETADLRIALEEGGLVPVGGAVTTTSEAGVAVEAVSFRCRPVAGGADVLVLTTTWRTPEQAWRARLQFPFDITPETASLLNGVRMSLRFRGAPTLGFGKYQMASQPPPASWTALAGVPGRSVSPAAGQLPFPTVASAERGAGLPPQISTAPPGSELGRLVQEYRGSLVFVEGGSGAGSGFTCRMRDGIFLLTNQHVLAGMATPRFTRLDQAPLAAGAGAAAVGHDLMRFILQGEARPLAAMETLEREAQIGDEIVVLGNMEGARVIQPLSGKLIGIGPDRIEVTAEFLPGNSGSPIIHVKSGKVIGIATYLLQRRFNDLTDPGAARVRRFGYRLDSVKQWQPLNWQVFQQEKGAVDRVEQNTRDLMQLIQDMQGDQKPNAAAYRNAAVSRAVRDLETTLSRTGISAPDRSRAFQSFLAAIRSATQTDIQQARQSLRYDYFLSMLKEEAQVREQMHGLFDRMMKAR